MNFLEDDKQYIFLSRKKEPSSIFKSIALTHTNPSKKLALFYNYFIRLDEFKFLCMYSSNLDNPLRVYTSFTPCNFALLDIKNNTITSIETPADKAGVGNVVIFEKEGNITIFVQVPGKSTLKYENGGFVDVLGNTISIAPTNDKFRIAYNNVYNFNENNSYFYDPATNRITQANVKTFSTINYNANVITRITFPFLGTYVDRIEPPTTDISMLNTQCFDGKTMFINGTTLYVNEVLQNNIIEVKQ